MKSVPDLGRDYWNWATHHMTQQAGSAQLSSNHERLLRLAIEAWPARGGDPATARAPAVADVMGGIAEDSGSLVLTATMGMAFMVSLWKIDGADLRVRFAPEAGAATARDLVLPMNSLGHSAANGEKILATCRESSADWAAPVCLALDRAIAAKTVARPASGWAALVTTDLPPDADWGRRAVLAAATIRALCDLERVTVEQSDKARLCSEAVAPICNVGTIRTAFTALSGADDGALLQISFHPRIACEPLPLPQGLTVLATRTSLGRPISTDRLIDTRLCAEMGHRYIQEALGRSSQASPPSLDRLSAITPTEFVERFRDVIPSKLSGKQYTAKFGDVRGLNGALAPNECYKIRSRAEHHIYENRRVQSFVTAINRYRRTLAMDALLEAGELMYASHWSHSQRCGIGGVETDRIVTCLRKHGPAAGLFGGKVTGSGNGGEMVILMRDDASASAALDAAIREAQTASNKTIHVHRLPRRAAEMAGA